MGTSLYWVFNDEQLQQALQLYLQRKTAAVKEHADLLPVFQDIIVDFLTSDAARDAKIMRDQPVQG